METWSAYCCLSRFKWALKPLLPQSHKVAIRNGYSQLSTSRIWRINEGTLHTRMEHFQRPWQPGFKSETFQFINQRRALSGAVRHNISVKVRTILWCHFPVLNTALQHWTVWENWWVCFYIEPCKPILVVTQIKIMNLKMSIVCLLSGYWCLMWNYFSPLV